jgi:response regulator NasT
MSRTLRIAVADDEPDMHEYYRTVLTELGHVVVAVAETGRELVETCRAQHPDLVITDIRMREMDGIDAAAHIYRDGPIPVMLVSADHDAQCIHRAEANHVLSYLVKPIERTALGPAITIVMRRFEQFQELRRELAGLRVALEDRKLIEQAKGLLMKHALLDETDAFRRLQKLASDRGLKLVAVARMLLTAEEAYQQPGSGPRRGSRH